jgi:hypothetical protein
VEEFTYTSEYKSPWKARRYISERDGYRYVMTVVDMSTTVLVAGRDQFRNVGRPGNEKRGAMAHAASNLRQTGKVTLDLYDELQVIPGHKLEIELPDGRQNIVEIHPHGNFLYILECPQPAGAATDRGIHLSFGGEVTLEGAALHRRTRGLPLRHDRRRHEHLGADAGPGPVPQCRASRQREARRHGLCRDAVAPDRQGHAGRL